MNEEVCPPKRLMKILIDNMLLRLTARLSVVPSGEIQMGSRHITWPDTHQNLSSLFKIKFGGAELDWSLLVRESQKVRGDERLLSLLAVRGDEE